MKTKHDIRMPTTLKKPETVRYIWNGTEKQKADLVCQLKKKQLIKRKRDLFDLFDKPHEDLMVQWNADYKPHLAYLLYRLFSDGYCSIRGSKGYFAYAEKHFFDSEGNSFPSNSLKKLSSKLNKNPEKYRDVIEDVGEIFEDFA